MQRHILPVIKSILTGGLLFFLTVMLSACGKEEPVEAAEKDFSIDHTEEAAILQAQQGICGQESAWFITPAKNDYIYKISYDAGAAGLEKIEWQPGEGEYYIVNIAEQGGTLYAEIWNKEEDTIKIRRYHTNGSWSECMSIAAKGEDSYKIVGGGFFVDSSERVYLVNGDTVECFGGEGKQAYTYKLRGDICFFQENEEGAVECVTVGRDEIVLYEFMEGRTEEKWTLKRPAGDLHGIRSSEEGTLCLATGMELLFVERESGELLSRTDLVKLGAGFIMAGYYDVQAGTIRLYGGAGNGGSGLSCSLLTEGDPLAPKRTELVYGVVEKVNSDASSSIRTAIDKFNQENQNYYVTIRDYEGNLDRMHADMAAGNGPDIIDMMYVDLNYESYVDNGYLEDLSPYLEQSQYRDDIIWNVLDAYRIDGGLYLLVPQFQFYVIVIHPEYEMPVEEWNMETFLELIEQNQWEKNLFTSTGDPEKLLKYILCGSEEEFIDWEQKTTSFETEEFMAVLELCREYAQADRTEVEEWTYEEKQQNTLYLETVAAAYHTSLSYAKIHGREYQLYGYPTLSGQAYRVNACADSCAIYAGSGQKEGAWEFIESLLWESNQKYHGIANPGFPIRSSVLQEMAAETKATSIRVNGGEKMTLTDGEIMILDDIIYNREMINSFRIDSKIWAVIQEEAAAYFAGDKSAQETAHIIQNRAGLILKE